MAIRKAGDRDTFTKEEENKMRIAIADDDTEFAKKIEEIIESFCQEAGEEAAVRRFPDGDSLLEELVQKREGACDAYILDVEMPGLDGLELARRIREREAEANIVFLSDFEKYALPAYKVRACDYILKERYRDEVPAILDRLRAERQSRKQDDYYTILTADTMERLHRREIRCLTKEKKYVVFYGMEGQMGRERTTLEKAYERLPHERFLYINKGCIVNMEHIINVKKDTVVLDNQMGHTISRNMAPRVREKVARYLEGKR